MIPWDKNLSISEQFVVKKVIWFRPILDQILLLWDPDQKFAIFPLKYADFNCFW